MTACNAIDTTTGRRCQFSKDNHPDFHYSSTPSGGLRSWQGEDMPREEAIRYVEQRLTESRTRVAELTHRLTELNAT